MTALLYKDKKKMKKRLPTKAQRIHEAIYFRNRFARKNNDRIEIADLTKDYLMSGGKITVLRTI